MKHGLYIVNFGYKITDAEKKQNGVLKKIIGQIKVFNDAGFKVDLLNVSENKGNYLSKFFYSLFYKNQYLLNNYDAVENIDFVYVRHFSPVNRGCLGLLSYLKKNGCKIIYEIPTYPYDGEHKGFKGFVFLGIDKIFRKKLRRYVDCIVTYSQDNTIFDIKTVKIVNGIDCSTISPVDVTEYRQDIDRIPTEAAIRLIAVAQFAKWHGYDRLIEGLYEYYKNNPKKKVFLDFVGDGSVLSQYQEMVNKYGVAQYVVFHGVLTGAALSAVFNQADVAVCSLGCHRIGIFLGSFLKSREYIARGLPMISSTKIDILPNDYQYIQYVSEDDSPIDINAVINFYDRLIRRENRELRIKNIRSFAENNCDMHITMQSVIDNILNIPFK
ncbi:glycosyltransferase [uncultured Treponema sp.]|uniref:glycosyltransferase n=1 Tax=uncultured Treponema sp. TaxID=162155 RepID=UPI0028EEE2E0|nr:glycosyltransferase [uncultured Treponema sp.]